MGLDIKIPIGFMFVILGLLVGIYGLTTMSDVVMYQKSFGININLWSGLFMLVFGAVMLMLSKFKKKN